MPSWGGRDERCTSDLMEREGGQMKSTLVGRVTDLELEDRCVYVILAI